MVSFARRPGRVRREADRVAARADGLPPPVDDGMGGPHEGVTLSVAAKAAQHPGQGARVW